MKARTQFYLTCICVLLPVVCISLYCHFGMIKFVDDEAPYFLWNREMVNNHHEEFYDTIILGDSTANAAYEPAVLSDGTINLALGGITPIDSYYILKNWLANNQAPKVCYISHFDAHFSIEAWFWKRVMFTHLHHADQNIVIMRDALKYKDPNICTENWLEDFVSYQLCLPDKYMTSIINAHVNQRYEANLAAQMNASLHSGRYMKKGTEEYAGEAEVYRSFTVAPLIDAYYRRLIELCIENGIQVRIVKLPVSETYSYSDEYVKEFAGYYAALKEEFPEITVDWIKNYEWNMFADKSHLNSHGALQFSTELKSMHPEDFNSDIFSEGQIAATNDSIQEENKVEEILKWMGGHDYTAVICDLSGQLGTVYNNVIRPEFGPLFPELGLFGPIWEDDMAKVYYVSGLDHEKQLDIMPSADGMTVQVGGVLAADWHGTPGMLGIVVVDNYNDCVVCTKSFRYVDNSFVLA